MFQISDVFKLKEPSLDQWRSILIIKNIEETNNSVKKFTLLYPKDTNYSDYARLIDETSLTRMIRKHFRRITKLEKLMYETI